MGSRSATCQYTDSSESCKFVPGNGMRVLPPRFSYDANDAVPAKTLSLTCIRRKARCSLYALIAEKRSSHISTVIANAIGRSFADTRFFRLILL